MNELLLKAATLRRSRDFNNVVYSLLSYCITPVILFISTPLLLHHMGDEQYGMWILVQSVLNVLAVSNFGLGNALIKLGSECRDDEESFGLLFRVTLLLAILLSAAISLLLLGFGTVIFPLLMQTDGLEKVLSASYYMGGIIGVRIINGIFSGAYMAKQRYDLNSKVNIVYNLITSVAFTILAVVYGSLTLLIQCLFYSTVLLTICNMFVTQRTLPGLKFRPAFNRGAFKRLFHYGIYSWGQMLISTLNAQVDKLIIGGLLGPKVLGYYTVCMQVVVKIHEIPAAAGGYLLPKFSSLSQGADRQEIGRTYRRSLYIAMSFVLFAGIVACLLAKPILSLWISPAFAESHYKLFQLLTVSVSLGAFGVVPYYCLNGTGYVKLNTILSLVTTLVTVALFMVLIPEFGVYGIGWGKFVGIPLVLFSLYFVEKRVLGGAGPRSGRAHEYQTERGQ
ncbi:lipopolysaccharide biosynthesis protein [Paenibacillus sp. NFR01]|uniref:lipopolysaccharide biosynthesis protein n=1 Tax=Paenibacillus sp. NFR01 TaxID=1566279 RepID=UPI0008B5DF45|nr:oligosaccharide flippase family protein [Paenibacillus sp. NFR01]SET99889.1 Membrane protein involved in the export of O-antigen and teichoic acid [Paenibacillus sp. NFR01]